MLIYLNYEVLRNRDMVFFKFENYYEVEFRIIDLQGKSLLERF